MLLIFIQINYILDPCVFSGLGFVTSIAFIFLVGVFMSSWLGASILKLGEWFIKHMPFICHIYNASKQISSAISPGNESPFMFSLHNFSKYWSDTYLALNLIFSELFLYIDPGFIPLPILYSMTCFMVLH